MQLNPLHILSADELIARLHERGVEPSADALSHAAGRLMVVKCGGSLVENPATGEGLLDDVALAVRAGVRIALVHGGSVQADRDMEAAGITPQRHRGLRITCERSIVILDRCFGRLNADIVEGLRRRGVFAERFHGAMGGLLRASKLVLDEVDLGFVGEVDLVRPEALAALPPGTAAVISAIVSGADGKPLNVNADYVATRLAADTTADRLILMSDVPGVLLDRNDPASRIPQLDSSRARALIADGTIDRGMIPKIESVLRALETGLHAVHIIDGRPPAALLHEIFTDGGRGTRIAPRQENSL